MRIVEGKEIISLFLIYIEQYLANRRNDKYRGFSAKEEKEGFGGDMFFVFPIGHEDQTVQRMPYVTISIIVINVLIFIFTSYSVSIKQKVYDEELRALIEFYVMHPFLDIEDVLKEDELGRIKEYLPHEEEYDLSARQKPLSFYQNRFMELGEKYRQARESLPYYKYGLVPKDPKAFNYLSSMFIHGWFFHLLFNMIFLWLVGCNIEDRWGRPLYLGFYLISGLMASYTHLLMFSNSTTPLIGASGAIAGIMGAFMIRMYKTKIRMFYLFWFITIRSGTFEISTFVALPFWLAQQLYYALSSSSINGGGVAFWAHIGGFIFGALVATAIIRAKIEEKFIKPKIDQKISFTQDPRIISSMANFDQGLYDEAITSLHEVLKTNPHNVDANVLLGRIYLKQGKKDEIAEVYKKLISIYLKDLKDDDLALDTYLEIAKLSPDLVLQPRDQVHIAHLLEKEGNLLGAAKAYDRLINKYPSAAETMKAILSYGNLCLNKLNEPKEALAVFKKGIELCTINPEWLEVMEEGLNKATAMI